MPNYGFFQKGQHIIVLKISDVDQAAQLMVQGYEKQFEEIYATNEKNALSRLEDIRKNNRIDRNNFLAGAGAMPGIGLLTVVMSYLFRKK
ncbi:hypothetical protein [Yokenella regensburgei]|uniref:hypothetical protein n=1 Tax=Yokenella regensburgei TaxID=158877 RepID=UPI003ED92044